MIRIKVERNDNIETILRRFRKLCEKEGLIKDIKRCQFYEKPSDRRRRERRRSEKKMQRMQQEQSKYW